jgi:flagellar basal-body rod protein FlgF
MDNSAYIALSRQVALFRDMENVANNLANVNTTGYNANQILFTSYLVKDNPRDSMAFNHDISSYRDTTVGTMHSTGNPLDIALTGKGYITVETPLGERYTRSGNLKLNEAGELVTQEGYPLLDNSGQRITFTQEDTNITFGPNGSVSASGEERGILALVTFENEQMMKRVGERMYTTDQTPTEATEAGLVQGVLENSNVQPVLEMTHMIDVSRSVGSTAKFIEVIYELQRNSTNKWTQQS